MDQSFSFTSQIQSCARKIDSDKETEQLEALTEVRKILSGLQLFSYLFSGSFSTHR
jgi:2-oxo-4-hydroxy-4-carboxy--5-ureidoimidazoline (OHCU) decarboxylase